MRAIQCQHLTHHFGLTQALNDVTVDFEHGKITGLLGRNGAGKTTLLNLICNRLPADEGQVLIDGTPAFENDHAQQLLYYMSEANFFPEGIRVGAAFKLCQKLRPGFDRTVAEAAANAFGLPLHHKVIKLSTGMRTLFRFCVALASNADYLLLDEPINGLDANNRELLYRLLIEKVSNDGCGVILSTHLIDEVAPLLESVVLIDQGIIQFNRSVEELLREYYMVGGAAAAVNAWIGRQRVISRRELGNYVTVGLAGAKPDAAALPAELELIPYTLQQLMIDLSSQNLQPHD